MCSIVFNDETAFQTSGHVHRHNHRYNMFRLKHSERDYQKFMLGTSLTRITLLDLNYFLKALI